MPNQPLHPDALTRAGERRRWPSSRIAVIALLVAASMQCQAKCARVEISVSGRVQDSAGPTIPNAMVVMSYIEAGVARSAVMRSHGDGEYRLKFYWDPLSGERVNRDLCEGKLESVTIRALAPGFDSSDDVVKLSNGTVRAVLRINRAKS